MAARSTAAAAPVSGSGAPGGTWWCSRKCPAGIGHRDPHAGGGGDPAGMGMGGDRVGDAGAVAEGGGGGEGGQRRDAAV